jgi:hypothetical protein
LAFVLDIEHRAHFIAIARAKAAVVKIDIAYERRVDKGKSFLLSAANEVGAEDLEVVHVNEVLIIGASAHIVL